MVANTKRPKELIVRSEDGQDWSIVGVDVFTEQKTTYITNMNFEQAKKTAEKLTDYFGIGLQIEDFSK